MSAKQQRGEFDMNNQAPLDHPELTSEYQDGVDAKQRGLTDRACPWGVHDLYRRCLWLAGFHDTDTTKAQSGPHNHSTRQPHQRYGIARPGESHELPRLRRPQA